MGRLSNRCPEQTGHRLQSRRARPEKWPDLGPIDCESELLRNREVNNLIHPSRLTGSTPQEIGSPAPLYKPASAVTSGAILGKGKSASISSFTERPKISHRVTAIDYKMCNNGNFRRPRQFSLVRKFLAPGQFPDPQQLLERPPGFCLRSGRRGREFDRMRSLPITSRAYGFLHNSNLRPKCPLFDPRGRDRRRRRLRTYNTRLLGSCPRRIRRERLPSGRQISGNARHCSASFWSPRIRRSNVGPDA